MTGFAFPFAKFNIVILVNLINRMMEKPGQEQHLNFIVCVHMCISLFFGTIPIYCMFKGSPTVLDFFLQYLPHAFAIKLQWFRNIPYLHLQYNRFVSYLCCSRQAVVPSPTVSSHYWRRNEYGCGSRSKLNFCLIRIINNNYINNYTNRYIKPSITYDA